MSDLSRVDDRQRVVGAQPPRAERPSLPALLRYFLRLGTVGFGGPIALAGHMQQDLVEQRGWISAQEYKEGLAFAQLAPGPLAAQLAIYLGWVRGRVLGATLVGIAFVAPSFLMVLILSELYVRFGGLPWMQGLFYGIAAAVIAIIARSVLKLVRMTLGRDQLLCATLAAIGVFLPVYLITVFLTPHFHRVAKNQQVKAFVDGVTAAATGPSPVRRLSWAGRHWSMSQLCSSPSPRSPS